MEEKPSTQLEPPAQIHQNTNLETELEQPVEQKVLIKTEIHIKINETTETNNDNNDDDNEDEEDDDEYFDWEDTPPVLQTLVSEFKGKDKDVDAIELDIHNVQSLKTIVSLLITAATLSDDEDEDAKYIIPNFVNFLCQYVERKKDDFDTAIFLVVGLQDLIQKLYSKVTAASLVVICEIFLTCDENTVKTEALILFSNLLHLFDAQDIEVHIVSYINKMYENEWWRCTGIDLMAIAYPKISKNHQSEFSAIFKKLIEDDSTLAKSAMAKNYAKVIKHYDQKLIETECIEMLELMTVDIQTTVRVCAVETAITLANLLDEDFVDKHICSVFERLVADQSWKIRLEVATFIVEIQKAVKPKLARMLLIALLRRLSVDLESVVRQCLASRIVQVLILFKETTDIDFEDLFEIVNVLNKDGSDEVKAALSVSIMDCTNVFGKEECRKFLLPLMKNTLMIQRISGVQKIDEQCVSNVNKLINVLGYPALQEDMEKFMFDLLSSESKWRTRRRLIMTINILALHSDEDYFTKYCVSFYKKLSNDHCHGVRRIVPMILPVLIGKFGFEWGRKNIFCWLFNFHDHPTYFQRLIPLYAVEELVNPSLVESQTRGSLLNSENHDNEHLYKVYSLNEMLKIKLDRLELNNSVVDEQTSAIRSDLDYYGEDMAAEFATFEMPSSDTFELLQFIMKHFLPIFANYLNDKVVNVVNRAIHLYKIILEFHRKLKKEFQQEEFKTIFENYTKENRQSIESNILIELAVINDNVDEVEEKTKHDVRGQVFEKPSQLPNQGYNPDENLDFNLDYGYMHKFDNIDDLLNNGKKIVDVDDRADCLDTDSEVLDADTKNGNHTDDQKQLKKTNTKTNDISITDGDFDDNDDKVQITEIDDDGLENAQIATGIGEDSNMNLLDDMNFTLFDNKKTVLEFYNSDTTSDAIDI